MNDRIREEHEQDYSARFDEGGASPRNDDERRVFAFYQKIRRGLMQHQVPQFDEAELTQSIARRLSTQEKPALPYWLPLIWKSGFVLAPVCIALILFCWFWPGEEPISQPVQEAVCYDALSQKELAADPAWNEGLRRGERVRVPLDREAVLKMKESSIIHCSPGTELALAFGRERVIKLNRGRITIRAAKVPGRKMVVKTSLADIEVVGTVFTVEVIP